MNIYSRNYEAVTLRGDSQVVLQLAGEWPCYDEHLNHYLDQIEKKAQNEIKTYM